MCKYLCATLVITSIDVYAPSSMSPSPSFSIVLYLFISIALLTARTFQKRSRPKQLTLCRSLHAETLQATASEGLAQGLYMAARAGFEPATFRSTGIDSTNAPPRPLLLSVPLSVPPCFCLSLLLWFRTVAAVRYTRV